MTITEGATLTLTATGQKVRVIGVDSNPTCNVWVCLVNDPDKGMFVKRAELSA